MTRHHPVRPSGWRVCTKQHKAATSTTFAASSYDCPVNLNPNHPPHLRQNTDAPDRTAVVVVVVTANQQTSFPDAIQSSQSWRRTSQGTGRKGGLIAETSEQMPEARTRTELYRMRQIPVPSHLNVHSFNNPRCVVSRFKPNQNSTAKSRAKTD
jgi:hypothetical protein